MGYDDHMDYDERHGLEQALDEVYSAIPDYVREKHGTLAEAVAAMADWPDKVIKVIEAERKRIVPDMAPVPSAIGQYVEGLDFAEEAVRNVE